MENTPAIQQPNAVQVQWGNMGVELSAANKQLAEKAAQVRDTLCAPPTKFEELPESEKIIAAAKKSKLAIVDERKTYTSRLDKVISKMMEAEKSIDEPLANYEAETRKVKLAYEAEQEKKSKREAEITTLKQHTMTEVANYEAALATYVNSVISKAFEHAIGEGNIEPAAKEKYIDHVINSRGTDEKFKSAYTFKVMQPYILDFNEAQQIAQPYFDNAKPYQHFLDLLRTGLIEKFSDYDLAWENKAIALQRSKEEAAKKAAEIEKEKATETAMASITSQAVDLHEAEPLLEVKSLKRTFEVDWNDTWPEAAQIAVAFFATVKKFDSIRAKPSKFTITQMAAEIGKIKTADNNFTFTGIKFKEVVK